MMYVKSPLKKSSVKQNKRGISGGAPAARKRRRIFPNKTSVNGKAGSYGQRIKPESGKKRVNPPIFTPWKVIAASILFGTLGILYIGHVFSTQQAYREVQILQNEYNKTKRLHDEKRLTFDRLIGPKEIYQTAREQGFINAGPADEIIHLKP